MLTLFTISIIAVGTIGFSTLAFANQNISQSEQSNSNPDIIPGKYIIILKDDASPQEILKKYGVGKIHQYEHAFNGLAITASDNQISAIKSDPRVVYIENDALVRASAQTIPPGIERIGATYPTRRSSAGPMYQRSSAEGVGGKGGCAQPMAKGMKVANGEEFHESPLHRQCMCRG